jgi:predicted cytidylate kinase
MSPDSIHTPPITHSASEDLSAPLITLTGDLGSGKTVVSRALVELTGLTRKSAGDFQRELAAQMGMTTLELNKYSEDHPEIDRQIDARSRELATLPGGAIVDARLGWHFLPQSFKVYLQTPPQVAAERIMADTQRQSEIYHSLDAAVRDITERRASERKRFLSLYEIDVLNPKNYDIIIDTRNTDPRETARLIVSELAMPTCRERSGLIKWFTPEFLLGGKAPEHVGSVDPSDDLAVAWNQRRVTAREEDGRVILLTGQQWVASAHLGGTHFVAVEIV